MEREEFKRLVESRLQEWQTQFDELKVKAALARADARDEIERRMDDLHHRREDLRRKLDAAEDKGADAWQAMKEGFERAGDEIKKAFDEVRAKMK